MHIPNGTKYKEDEDLTAEKKLSAQAKATEQKLAYISCWISLIIIISKIIYTNRARIYKLTSSVGSFISDGKFGSRESLGKASELMVLAGSTLTEILYESRWILFPVLAGVGMTVLTWYTIYIDSCIPGVKPPTPFSQNRTNSDGQSLSTSADNVNSSIRTADVLSLPKVKIYLDNVGLSALLDSGSGRSFINKQMADNLNLKLRHCDIRCFNASSVPMSVLGYVRCKIKIDKYSWQYDFLVVPNLLCPLILGVDFMTHVGMLIDFALREFHFAFYHDNKISFTNESSIVESSPIYYTEFLSFFEDNDLITPNLSHLNAQQGNINDIIKEFPDVLRPYFYFRIQLIIRQFICSLIVLLLLVCKF